MTPEQAIRVRLLRENRMAEYWAELDAACPEWPMVLLDTLATLTRGTTNKGGLTHGHGV